ncbi:MAG: tyrosine recombinase XerC [Eubacteriales bacterium]
MSTLPKILDEFAAYKLTIQNRSRLTVDQYLLDLTLFFQFMEAERKGIPTDSEEFGKLDISHVDIDYCSKITRQDIYDFLQYVASDRNNQARARARKLSSLRSFFKYLTGRMNYFKDDPTGNIESPSIKPSLPKFLSEEEALRLLEAVEKDTNSKNTIRDYCILTLFLNCGMRLSELVGIDLRDLDPNLRSIRVVGKGSKERIIYLNDACKSAISAWLLHRGTVEIKDKHALYVSSRGNRISNKTVQAMVYKYLDAAGLGNRKLSVHKLRHTAATLMYQTGKVDVRMLKDILGHEQLNTTQIYTHVSSSGMEKAMQENPLASVRRKGATAGKSEDSGGDEEEKNS